MEAQQSIAACMAAEGFEYIPFVPAEVGGGFVGEEWDEEEYVKTYGFGVSTWILQEQEMFGEDGQYEDPYSNDPNNEIVDAMDEFEREEYYRVLYGGEPPLIANLTEEDWASMTEEEINELFEEAYADWQPDGCQNEAYNELYGGGEADMAFWEEFGEDFDEMYMGMESDPRIVEAQSSWSSCMADKGFDYADQEEMYAYFYGTDRNGEWVEGDFQQRVNELIVYPDYVFEEPVEGEEGVATTMGTDEYVYQPPEVDMEKLQPLIDEELAVALANYECDKPLRDLYESLYEEYQQRFIDENLDRLLAFREENG